MIDKDRTKWTVEIKMLFKYLDQFGGEIWSWVADQRRDKKMNNSNQYVIEIFWWIWIEDPELIPWSMKTQQNE
jgi:hypothetical protein